MSKIEKIIDLIKEQFEDGEKLNLTQDTNFKQLEDFDSLTGMCIIVAIKDEFGVEIKEEDFRKAQTIKELDGLI